MPILKNINTIYILYFYTTIILQLPDFPKYVDNIYGFDKCHKHNVISAFW